MKSFQGVYIDFNILNKWVMIKASHYFFKENNLRSLIVKICCNHKNLFCTIILEIPSLSGEFILKVIFPCFYFQIHRWWQKQPEFPLTHLCLRQIFFFLHIVDPHFLRNSLEKTCHNKSFLRPFEIYINKCASWLSQS